MAYYDGELLKQNLGKAINEFEELNVPLSEVAIKIGQAIKNTPTADVEEVRHGWWITNIENGSTVAGVQGGFAVGYRCSICGRFEMQKESYCNCGAKMDGERK